MNGRLSMETLTFQGPRSAIVTWWLVLPDTSDGEAFETFLEQEASVFPLLWDKALASTGWLIPDIRDESHLALAYSGGGLS